LNFVILISVLLVVCNRGKAKNRIARNYFLHIVPYAADAKTEYESPFSNRDEPRLSCLGGLESGHGEREPITGVWGRSPQRGPGAEPEAEPPEAENLLASGCPTEAANLPHSVRTLTLSKSFMKLVPALFRSANVLETAAPARE